MSKKRGIVIADPHCGHLAGLTPPSWQSKEHTKSKTKRNKWVVLQSEMWKHYKYLLKKFGPFDFGLSMGDLVDGAGHRSGGVELITSDREEQADMAVAVHDQVRLHANKGFSWVGVYGTAYHSGTEEDWENIVADRAGFKKIGSHEWIDVNGCIIDCKHHVGGSTIPHGRHTAVAKERLWSVLWAERALTPKANVILRAHVHYHAYCGGPGWVAMTLPALQGMGSKFGARRCSGLVDWGLTVFDIATDGSFDWHSETVQIEAQRAKVVKI